MNFNNIIKFFIFIILCAFLLLLNSGCSTPEGRTDLQPAGRVAKIQPDYAGIVIPANIAPLNFVVKEAGKDYFARVRSTNGEAIRIQSSSGCMQIPLRPWKRLLVANLGEPLTVDIYVKDQDGRWIQFNPIVNRIAREPVDGYLVYRKFYPLFNYWKKMGIYQRCLENFDEKPVLLNRQTLDNCMNCHNFWHNGTDQWLLHLRSNPGTAMLLVLNGQVSNIKTKTKFNPPTAYPAWHPSGKIIAFSCSNLLQFFHTTGECRDVLDRYSDIVLYDIATNTITTAPQISNPERLEIWPAWSPDGKFLYFCSAPKVETFVDSASANGFDFDRIKYDLMRVAYDPENRSWGKVDTVISSVQLGLSITEPRVSPDGRFLLFTAAKYSQFPIYLPSADLYLLDLHTGSWKKSEVNSERADSFHSWSSNSRWIVFSSKRQDGLFTRPYFSYLDSLGHASKPFVMPQENPLFYESSLQIYNVPELTNQPIHESPQVLARAAFAGQSALTANLDPNVVTAGSTDKTTSSAPLSKIR
jgi:hypothetical protein